LYPNFIGIGAQKSGTTWLSRNLGLHPEIWIPSVKEVHYFDDRIKDLRTPYPGLGASSSAMIPWIAAGAG
jgi:hypothetical protein